MQTAHPLVRVAVSGALGLAATLAAAAADAQDCASLPNPLYIQTGDTQEPLMKSLGRQLRENTVNPISLVYVTAGSCTNVEAMYTGLPMTTTPKYIPSIAEDPLWDPSMPAPTCNIPVEGVPLDLGISATFVESCNPNPPPTGIALITGPIQAYLFVVPEASTQQVMTAEEGYFTFGFGEAGQIDPWNDESLLFVRAVTKSTLLTTMAAIGVPPAKTKGVVFDQSSQLVNAMVASPNSEKSIGLLGAEIYDRNRDVLDVLAFRAFDQKKAYYPDKTANSFDKQNVRDGHYTPWSPTVYIAPVDGNGDPEDPDVAYLIDLVLGHEDISPAPAFDSLSTVIAQGLLPDCSMKVRRDLEGGNLSLFDAPEPCHCFYENEVGSLGESCVACTNDTTCGGGKCRARLL
jgi:hypothetical protein